MTALAQRSFAGGELAPSLHARTDLTKYASGARTIRNLMIQRHGGLTNRAGLPFIGEVKDSTQPVRLLKFVLVNGSATNTYALEFGDRYVRFYQNGARVIASGVAAWVTATPYTVGDLVTQGGVTYYCTTAHTSGAASQPGVGASWATNWYALSNITGGAIYEIPTPYAVGDLPTLQIAQSKNTITIVHPTYAPRELLRVSNTRWLLTAIAFAPIIATPLNVILGAGAAGADTWYAVTAIDSATGEESLASVQKIVGKIPAVAPNAIVITWNAVAGAQQYNIYRSTDGFTFGLIARSGGTVTPHTDNTYATNPDSVVTAVQSSAFVQSGSQVRNALGVSVTDRAVDGKYRLLGTLLTQAAGGGARTVGRGAIYYSRDGESRVFAGRTSETTIYGDTTSTIAMDVTIDVPDNGYAALTIDVVPEVWGAGGVGSTYTVTITGTSVNWSVNAVSYSDTGVAVADMLKSPPAARNPFSSADNYPSTVNYYQQRRVFANSNTNPETIWGSRSGLPPNFTVSFPLQDDDAVTFTLVGQKANAIRHLLDLGRLIVFTSSEEKMAEGDASGILKPDAVNPRKLSANGSGSLKPIELDDSALYVQARGTKVRDFKPVSADAYEGTDLTIFAAHLFDGFTLSDWDYAQNPHSIVWIVRSDGTLLGLTYIRDQAVWGWHRHDTDGVFENVCVVPEGNEDAVYFVVRRTINGATKRYIERMASRFFTAVTDANFLDASVSIDGRNTGATTMTLTGGVNWDYQETLTLTANVASFAAGDVGNSIFLTAADGTEHEFQLQGFTSNVVMTGHLVNTVPADLRGIATTAWAKGIKTVTGLAHLEGKKVGVFADGYVVASPNNSRLPFTATVAAGQIVLDRPYKQIKVGLSFISDLETLNIDSSGANTISDKKSLIGRLGLFIEKSRGIFAGKSSTPTTADPLKGLQEFKARESETYAQPVSLTSGKIEVPLESTWDDNGRVFVRQVDPLPLTINAIFPIGQLPAA